MKEYVIITYMYECMGGMFKYAQHPKKKIIKFEYTREQREDFIVKTEHILKDDMYYDKPKLYYIDYENVTILDITYRFEEIKNSI